MKIRELFEGKKSSKLAFNQQLGPYKKNAAAIASGKAPALWRGMDVFGWATIPEGQVEFIAMPERASGRESKTGSNFLIDYVSKSPDWAKIPDRQFSVSCATTRDVADMFGDDPWLIIPADSVSKYAQCPTDFNEAYPSGIDRPLMELLGQIESIRLRGAVLRMEAGVDEEMREILSRDIFSVDGATQHRYTMSDIQELSDALDEMNMYFASSTAGHAGKVGALMRSAESIDEFTREESLMRFLKTQVNPTAMKIKSHARLTSIKRGPREEEIWFRGPFMAIRTRSGSSLEELQKLLAP